jgi:hypothetical protein
MVGLFLGGGLASATLAGLTHQARPRPPLLPPAVDAPSQLDKLVVELAHDAPSTQQMSSFFEQPVPFAAHALLNHPNTGKLLLPVGALAAGAFLGNTLLDGLQEAWVRWEESCIRAQLVDRLGESFAHSIQQKQQQDDANRDTALTRINQSLQSVGLAPLGQDAPAKPWAGQPSLQQASAHNQFFYMPQPRQPFGDNPKSAHGSDKVTPHYWLLRHAKPAINGLAFASGALAGYLGYLGVASVVRPHPAAPSVAPPSTHIKSYLNAKDFNALWLNLVDKKQWRPLLGAVAMGSLLGIGKLFISGLREIEVTRLNAETEYQYETYKWQQLDTRYHNVAETTQLNHALDRFEATLPQVAKADPQQAYEQAQRIVEQVGYWSPPPYYPVTPTVQLVTARS